MRLKPLALGEGPHALAIIRDLATSLIRLKGINAIKETVEWIADYLVRALHFRDYLELRLPL